MKNKLIEICKKAKKASNQIIDNKIKNKVLLKFAHLVNKNKFIHVSSDKPEVLINFGNINKKQKKFF